MAVVALRPPYSRLPCTICTRILEKKEQEYILEFYIAINVLTYFSDPGCLVNSSDKLLFSLYRSFPKLGVEGRCLPNCNTVRTLAGLDSFWICNMDECTGTEPWMPDADKRELHQPCTGNWGFFPRCAGKCRGFPAFCGQ